MLDCIWTLAKLVLLLITADMNTLALCAQCTCQRGLGFALILTPCAEAITGKGRIHSTPGLRAWHVIFKGMRNASNARLCRGQVRAEQVRAQERGSTVRMTVFERDTLQQAYSGTMPAKVYLQ